MRGRLVVVGFLKSGKGSAVTTIGAGAFIVFLLGSFLSQWIANWLATQRPRR